MHSPFNDFAKLFKNASFRMSQSYTPDSNNTTYNYIKKDYLHQCFINASQWIRKFEYYPPARVINF